MHDDPLQDLYDHLEKWFYKPDLQATRIILGTAYSHYLPSKAPTWLFVVGPPSSGKTAISITALQGLEAMFGKDQPWGFSPDLKGDPKKNINPHRKEQESIHTVSVMNENTFLSHQVGAHEPGLLEQLGPVFPRPVKVKKGQKKPPPAKKQTTRGSAIFLTPDFTVVTSMKSEKRGEILGQLRRIFDGDFEKKIGTRVTKIWEGKITLIAAVTNDIDRFLTLSASLGERFIQIKWRTSEDRGQTIMAMKQEGNEDEIKGGMREFTRDIFFAALQTLPTLTDEHYWRLDAIAEFLARSRCVVKMQYWGDEKKVVSISPAEKPHRIAREFKNTLNGVCCIQRHTEPTEPDMQDILRLGIESLDLYRSVCVQAAIEQRPLSEYDGNHRLKADAAEALSELGVLEKILGGAPPRFKKRFQALIDDCQFEPGVFVPDGAVAESKRVEVASEGEDPVVSL